MHFFKATIVSLFGLAAMTAAAPGLATNADVADAQDGCNAAYRGEWRACERGRDLKHDGRDAVRQGERQLERGNIVGGLTNILNGARDENRGKNRQCRTGGRC